MKRCHRHLTALQTAQLWLHDFERLLQYTAPPVREWLRETAAAPRYKELPFIEGILQRMENCDLKTAWEDALKAEPGWLDAEDVAILRTFGQYVGKSDAQTQLQCVTETLIRLDERCETAKTAAHKADKLYLTLGVSGGLATAIFLM